MNANKIITYQNGILFIPPQFVQWKPGQAHIFHWNPPSVISKVVFLKHFSDEFSLSFASLFSSWTMCVSFLWAGDSVAHLLHGARLTVQMPFWDLFTPLFSFGNALNNYGLKKSSFKLVAYVIGMTLTKKWNICENVHKGECTGTRAMTWHAKRVIMSRRTFNKQKKVSVQTVRYFCPMYVLTGASLSIASSHSVILIAPVWPPIVHSCLSICWSSVSFCFLGSEKIWILPITATLAKLAYSGTLAIFVTMVFGSVYSKSYLQFINCFSVDNITDTVWVANWWLHGIMS